MQVKLLNEYIDKYGDFLATPKARRNLNYWISQKHFLDHWDMKTHDFKSMYNQSLFNPNTKRLWKRENYEPKIAMLKLIEYAPHVVFEFFQDLFNESVDIEDRLEKFRFHLDELLNDYRDSHPVSPLNNHYHDSYEIISLYLAFRFPNQYTLYRLETFQRFSERTGARKIPQHHVPASYFKILKTLMTLLSKNKTVLERHEKRLGSELNILKNSYLLAFDYMDFVAS